MRPAARTRIPSTEAPVRANWLGLGFSGPAGGVSAGEVSVVSEPSDPGPGGVVSSGGGVELGSDGVGVGVGVGRGSGISVGGGT